VSGVLEDDCQVFPVSLGSFFAHFFRTLEKTESINAVSRSVLLVSIFQMVWLRNLPFLPPYPPP